MYHKAHFMRIFILLCGVRGIVWAQGPDDDFRPDLKIPYPPQTSGDSLINLAGAAEESFDDDESPPATFPPIKIQLPGGQIAPQQVVVPPTARPPSPVRGILKNPCSCQCSKYTYVDGNGRAAGNCGR